jgi:membrane-associated phospholipid phosphatase
MSPNLPPAAEENTSGLEKVDVEVTAKLASHRGDPAVKAAGKLSELGDQPPLFTLGALLLGFGVVTRREREIEAGLRMLAAEALATQLKSLVKHRFARTRPRQMLDKGEYRAEAEAPEGKHEQSFPSGHTAGAVAVAGALAAMYPKAAVPLYGVAAAVAAVQPARGAHYVADVAAGAVVGGVSALAVNAGARWFRSLRR